jgi:hypothetical protein
MKDEMRRLCELAARHAQEPRSRRLTFVFYGMVCFDPYPKDKAYRVLFPNGLQSSNDVPMHVAGAWVRKRSEKAKAAWKDWCQYENDFFVEDNRKLNISGLAHTPLIADQFEGHVTNLKDCDRNFEIRDDHNSIIEMTVDRGTLTSHVVNEKGMIAASWVVYTNPGETVEMKFEDVQIEIPPSAHQVFLSNVEPEPSDQYHFGLFRKLSTAPNDVLQHKMPPYAPQPLGSLELDDPTFGTRARCPDVVCSVVQSKLSPFHMGPEK